MRRNINSAVFLGASKPEHVVVLVNRSANRAERVVAVRQNIRNRKLFKPRSARRLNNSNISNIVRSNFVKFDFQFRSIARSIVPLQDRIRNSVFSTVSRIFARHGLNQFSARKKSAVFPKFHKIPRIVKKINI